MLLKRQRKKINRKKKPLLRLMLRIKRRKTNKLKLPKKKK